MCTSRSQKRACYTVVYCAGCAGVTSQQCWTPWPCLCSTRRRLHLFPAPCRRLWCMKTTMWFAVMCATGCGAVHFCCSESGVHARRETGVQGRAVRVVGTNTLLAARHMTCVQAKEAGPKRMARSYPPSLRWLMPHVAQKRPTAAAQRVLPMYPCTHACLVELKRTASCTTVSVAETRRAKY